MAPPVLSVRNVARRFGRAPVLDGVSFEIPGAGVHALAGLNGAGKTTLLRIIGGLLRPHRGKVSIGGGESVSWNPGGRRGLGALIESPALHPELTVREHLRCYGRFHRNCDPERQDRLMESVGLGPNGDKRARDLSLGMRQRLGIALALLGDPVLVLLDEPTNGLDPAGMAEMRELIRAKADREGTAFLISSHQLSEFEDSADRILLLHGGRLLRDQSMAGFFEGSAPRWILDASPAERARACLEARPPASDLAEIAPGRFRWTPAGRPPSATIKDLVDAGVEVQRAAPERRSLESLFLEVLGSSG